ncbi:MAG: DivIVA domain-containing protein [Actinomycetales bacterium]|nr:DivIVA domain-containing protein [Actinomycetales bacterium]
MALTPEDVRNKQFSTAKRKGYEMDEVDSFLDQVELELGNLARQNAELKGRVTAAEQAAAAAAAAPPPPVAAPAADHNEQAVAVLALAQKTADEHKSRAKAEADAMIANAQAKVAELERAGTAERAALERRVEELRAFEREYRTRLRQHHEAALKELETRGGDVAPAAPAAAAAAPTPQLAPPTAPAPASSASASQPAPVAPAAPAPAPVPPPPPAQPQQAPAQQTPPPTSPFALPPHDAPPREA